MIDTVEDATKAKRAGWLRIAGIVAALGLLVGIVNFATHGNFLQPGNLVNVLRQISYNTILALGQTFVIITSGIDLSVGSLVAMCGVVMALFANYCHLSGFPLVLATLAVGVLVGALAGYVNALPVVKLNIPPFITTLAMMEVALGLAFIFSHGRPIVLNSDAFSGIGVGSFLQPVTDFLHLPAIPVPVVWMAAMIVGGSILLNRTRFGRYVRALGGNEEAARLAGVGVARVKTMVYVISGVCAAIVGFLYMARYTSGSPQTSTGDELLESIAAVVVGGTSLMGGRGSIVGTFLGALLIGVLYNSMNLLGVDSYLQKVVLGIVIALAVVGDELRKRYLSKA
ncbi:MAG: ABC transporter permease [Candidatus Eremiobacteraeota bacterium]|nr:ABC transporter permease [Candidatus Eremiobacteraeota bacterium]